MKIDVISMVWPAILCFALYLTLADAAPVSDSAINRTPSKEELMLLAKILAPLKELALEADDLQSLVERAAKEPEFAFALAKRQGAWDMDYGWGGGRFGKRAQAAAKRYDSFGLGGRFGRSVDFDDEKH